MNTDRTAVLQRLKNNQSVKRYRMRKTGLLPSLPLCPNCGAKIRSDRWLPLCSICARAINSERGKARPLRLAAEEIIRELRQEARAGV